MAFIMFQRYPLLASLDITWKGGPSGPRQSSKVRALAPPYFFFGRYIFSIDATIT